MLAALCSAMQSPIERVRSQRPADDMSAGAAAYAAAAMLIAIRPARIGARASAVRSRVVILVLPLKGLAESRIQIGT